MEDSMEQSKYLTALKESIVNMDFDAVTRVAREAMAAGIEPQLAIAEGMVPGMSIVGDKFASGEYFLSELVVAGEVMREGLKVINPYLKGSSSSGSAGKVILATVEGDLHNLGKNIVATLLTVHGFEVIDLGVDVPTQRIVDAVW
jgi:methanogenic corrinoid protein MtbC1